MKDQEMYAKVMNLSPQITQSTTVPVAGLTTWQLLSTFSSVGTIYMDIDGYGVTSGWSYDQATYTITFSPARTAGEVILVSNKTI